MKSLQESLALSQSLQHFVKADCTSCFLFYLIEVCILHGGEVESRLSALELQHVIQQLGGHLHIVAVESLGVVGGALKQTHNSLGVLAVHPRAVASQVVVLQD